MQGDIRMQKPSTNIYLKIKSFQMGQSITFWSLHYKQDLHRISAKCMTITIHTNPAQHQEYWKSDVLLCTWPSLSPTLVISIAPSTVFQEMLYCFQRTCSDFFLRIQVVLLEHLYISSSSTIFNITINSLVTYWSLPAELNVLEILSTLELCLKIFLYLQENSRSLCERTWLPPACLLHLNFCQWRCAEEDFDTGKPSINYSFIFSSWTAHRK
jgi:hypothetical protein